VKYICLDKFFFFNIDFFNKYKMIWLRNVTNNFQVKFIDDWLSNLLSISKIEDKEGTYLYR
jgi:hypothetical protein